MRRISDLLRQLTLEEKTALLEGTQSWNTNPVPRLGVPALFLTDGPHGLRKVLYAGGGFAIAHNQHSTAFPTAVAVASSWEPENARRMGRAIAQECVQARVNVLLAPGINIKRSPLCGRNFEYFSEDPLLSGAFGTAFVQGVQECGVGCCVKHFAANSNENYRFMGDSLVDERTLREIYLRAFERVVREAHPYAVMCAYNRLNGVHASENRWLLTTVLREEWGFDGAVVTDWGAVNDRVAGVKAGCDLEMPGGVLHNRNALLTALRDGTLAPSELDTAVERVLTLVERCTAAKKPDAGDKAAQEALAADIAAQGAVLLKNDGTLPLTGVEALAVVGELFEKLRFQGAGSSLIHPPTVVTPRDAFDRRGIRYVYAPGYRCGEDKRKPGLEGRALEAAEQADTVLFFGGLTDWEESEGFDREHMALSRSQTALLEQLLATGKRVVLVLFTGAPVELPFFEGLSAVLDMHLPGMCGGEATAALLYGERNPCGKLAESWPLRASDASCADDYNRGLHAAYYESVYVGYRFYDTAEQAVRFPFGYGLSYTTFAYGPMTVKQTPEAAVVTASVTNTGVRDGAEAMQLYAKHPHAGSFGPEKELCAFAKVALKAGETKTVTLTVAWRELMYWHCGRHAWVLENGRYTLCLAASCADIRQTAEMDVTHGENTPPPYDETVLAAYRIPPRTVPDAFAALLGEMPPAAPTPVRPFTMDTPLGEYRHTVIGRLLYAVTRAVVRHDYRKALRLPDSLERDSRVKNTYFLLRMLPHNSVRALCMSSDGKLTYSQAQGLVELANGRLLRSWRELRRKETTVPLHKDAAHTPPDTPSDTLSTKGAFRG